MSQKRTSSSTGLLCIFGITLFVATEDLKRARRKNWSQKTLLLYLHIVVTVAIGRKGLTDVSSPVLKIKFMHAFMVKEGTEQKMRLFSFKIDCQYRWDRNLCTKLWFDNAYEYFQGNLEVGGMAALSKPEWNLS